MTASIMLNNTSSSARLGIPRRTDDSDAKPPTTPVLRKRAYFEEVEEGDEVAGSALQQVVQKRLIE